MATYRVVLSQPANYVMDVEAKDADDAVRIAERDAYAGLCHQCAHQVDLDAGSWQAIDDEPELVSGA